MSGVDLQTATIQLYMRRGTRIPGRSKRGQVLLHFDHPTKFLTLGDRSLRRWALGMLTECLLMTRITATTVIDAEYIHKVLRIHLDHVLFMTQEYGQQAIDHGLTRHQAARLHRVTRHLMTILHQHTHDGKYRAITARNLTTRQSKLISRSNNV